MSKDLGFYGEHPVRDPMQHKHIIVQPSQPVLARVTPPRLVVSLTPLQRAQIEQRWLALARHNPSKMRQVNQLVKGARRLKAQVEGERAKPSYRQRQRSARAAKERAARDKRAPARVA